MSLWSFRKKAKAPADTGEAQQSRKTVKRWPARPPRSEYEISVRFSKSGSLRAAKLTRNAESVASGMTCAGKRGLRSRPRRFGPQSRRRG
jgi:hypothetical protein